MKSFIYIFTYCLLFTSTAFAQVNLVFDGFNNNNEIRFFTQLEFNNQFVFTYEDTVNYDVWITNGVTTTNLTDDISSRNFGSVTVVGDNLYFVEYEDNAPYNLWKTDGTIAGNQKVWDSVYISQLTAFQNKLVATVAEDNLWGVWLIDGNTKTKLIDSIWLNYRFTEYNNELYFFTKTHGLMRTDGTAAGTVLVKPFDAINFEEAWLSNTAVYNGELYFRGCDKINGCQLWKTNGTDTGTVVVNDLDPVLYLDNYLPNASNFTSTDNQLYIYTREKILLLENQTITTLFDFGWLSRKGEIQNAAVVNNRPVFVIETYQKNGRELWTSDGTPNGTKLLKEINRSAANGLDDSRLVKGNGYLYFEGNDGVFGNEIWRTDGTAEGTEMLIDFSPRGASTIPDNIFVLGDNLYFTKRNYKDGWGLPITLWQIDLSNFTPEQPTDYRSDEEWLTNIYAGYYNRLVDFEIDKNNNAYVAMLDESPFIENNIFFDQDTSLFRDNTLIDVAVIAKMSNENEFLWGTTIHTGEDNYYKQNIVIAPDNDENLFVAGLFTNRLVIGDTTIISGEVDKFFIAKFRKNGALDWIHTGNYTSDYHHFFQEMLVTPQNEVLLIGSFNRIDFKGNTFSGNNSSFVLKLDGSGKYLWLNKFSNNIQKVTADLTPNNDIIVATSRNGINLYKINQSGVTLWQKYYPNDESTMISQVKVSPLNEIFMVGSYLKQINIRGMTANFDDERYSNAFLAKFNALGEPIYLEADETTISNYADITFDADNHYYLLKKERLPTTSAYENWERFATNWITYIQRFDVNGQLERERKLLNRNAFHTDFSAIRTDNEGNIYLADKYYYQLDTFANCIYQTTNTRDIIFVLHFSMDKKMEIYEPTYLENDLTIVPNPMTSSCLISTYDDNWKTYHLNIYSSTGQLLKSVIKNDEVPVKSLRVADLPSGLLIFEFSNGTEKIVRKVVKY